MVEINKFITKMEQGLTEAFLCGGVDQHNYVVKSKRAGKETLIREHVCGRLAAALGLPIPQFEFVYVPKSVAMYSVNTELSDISEMPGFGSRQITTEPGNYNAPSLSSLNVADVRDVATDVRALVLLFDWWVLNPDRIDGNPNLLWDAQQHDLHVIDHNLTFDGNAANDFWDYHIFREDRGRLSDPGFRQVHQPMMLGILQSLPKVWAELPEDWLDGCIVTQNDVDGILRRVQSEDFWLTQ